MRTKDLNIFVYDTIICYDSRALPVSQLFADTCEVTFKRFDILNIIYQAISGFILLINGPPRKEMLNHFPSSNLIFFNLSSGDFIQWQ